MGTEAGAPEPQEPARTPSTPPEAPRGFPRAVSDLGLPAGTVILWLLSALCYFFHKQPGGGKSAGFDLDWLFPMALLVLGSVAASMTGLILAVVLKARRLRCASLLVASLGGPLLLWGAGVSVEVRDKARSRAEERRAAPILAAEAEALENLVGKRHPRLFDHGQAMALPPADGG